VQAIALGRRAARVHQFVRLAGAAEVLENPFNDRRHSLRKTGDENRQSQTD
jgi:hypothetical protein